jgi:hypothetical protein
MRLRMMTMRMRRATTRRARATRPTAVQAKNAVTGEGTAACRGAAERISSLVRKSAGDTDRHNNHWSSTWKKKAKTACRGDRTGGVSYERNASRTLLWTRKGESERRRRRRNLRSQLEMMMY